MSGHRLGRFEPAPGQAQDKRQDGPRRFMDAPVTVFYKGRRLTCTVRDLSRGGAGLIVDQQTELPNWFNLTIGGRTLPAHVVWRRRNRIGVQLGVQKPTGLAGLFGKLLG